MSQSPSSRIAAVQASSVFLDLEATLSKAHDLVRQAADEGAQLVVFPEAFLSGYPVWVWFAPAAHTHPLREAYTALHRSSITIPGPVTDQLGELARDAGVTIAIGVNEKNAQGSDSTLFNTLLYVGPDGSILGSHRKLIPTTGERLVWGRGDGDDLDVHQLPFGRVSGLICWENYMPLARYTLAARGVQIYVAPTWDHGEPWLSSMRHIAKECRCFVVSCCQAFHVDDVPDGLAMKKQYLEGVDGWINPGGSAIVDPDGKLVAGPAESEETILYADVHPDQLVGPRWQLDIAGNYSRPDVFELRVRGRASPVLGEIDEAEESGP